MTQREPELLADVVGELDVVMKSEGIEDLRSASIPLLEICLDGRTSSAEPFDQAIEELLTVAIEQVQPAPDRNALAHLFLGDGRWLPMARRGPLAAAELDLTYDALRRRNKTGHRRIDSLLTTLAQALIVTSGLTDPLGTRGSLQLAVTNPDENAVGRASVFLSYSRSDDEHEGGLISALRESLVSEFRFQTGQELFVFHDKTSIDPGENWKRKLQRGVDEASFLLVLLTPSYLKSPACRQELMQFLARESERDRDDLILPIYYSSVPQSSEDPLVGTLLGRQYIDWRSLRFQPFASAPVRIAVANLAGAIAMAIARTADIPGSPDSDAPSEDLGSLERLGAMDLAMPRFVRSLVAMAAEQEEVTVAVQEATEEIHRLSREGRGSAARVIVARRLSSRLDPYADRMEQSADAMRRDLNTVKEGIRAMTEILPTSVEEGVEDATQSMIVAIQEAHSASNQMAASVMELSVTYSETARIASTLRPVLNRLAGALRVVSGYPADFAEFIEMLQKSLRLRQSTPG